MPPFAVVLSPKFPKPHPEHSPSSPCLKSLVLALAARNNRTGKGREEGSPSAAKHINLQIYLVGIIPEGETDPILHHPPNCPHLFRDSNRRPGTCARSGSEATCPCFPGSHFPFPEMFLDVSLPWGNSLGFSWAGEVSWDSLKSSSRSL